MGTRGKLARLQRRTKQRGRLFVYIDPKEMRLKKDDYERDVGKIFIGEWLGLIVTAKHTSTQGPESTRKEYEQANKNQFKKCANYREIRHPNIVIFWRCKTKMLRRHGTLCMVQ